MIDEHLDQLHTTLEQAEGLPEGTKAKLLELLATVRQEATGSSSGDEPATETPNVGMTGLLASVEQLEASHPEVASLINQVAITLSRMGI